MHPILVAGPAVEPISLEEMKAHLRIDDDAEDALITGLVQAARVMVEGISRRILIEQRWRVMLDAWPPGGEIRLPLSPLIAVDDIQVFDKAGTATDIAADLIDSDAARDPPRVIVRTPPQPGKPRNGISIALRAGYGATPESVPSTLRLAVKLIAARWYAHRGDEDSGQAPSPETVSAEALALIAPFRRARL